MGNYYQLFGSMCSSLERLLGQINQCPLLADSGLSNVNFKISLLSVYFRPKADIQRCNHRQTKSEGGAFVCPSVIILLTKFSGCISVF